ncbi:MAG: isoprenyl transferase [Deltaproteobacteria bacterium]|nr:isoprenyl transferase [Deltaproteobacteria bacterium]MBW2254385.1 isoprenyl transferase [Deltaproteobacteria bacterium]
MSAASTEGFQGPVPRHVAIIMDGNGRWAQRRGLPRTAGHEAGAKSVRKVVRACGKLGVEVLTLYSFSTENWSRPEAEVAALMGLLEHYLRNEVDELMDRGVSLRAIGQVERLPPIVQQLLADVIAATADNRGLNLVIAVSYGSRAELADAVRQIACEVRDGSLNPEEVGEDTISSRLYTASLPDPDLLVRTSGEMRLSNFLLWQVAYSELYVTDVLWPDFGEEDLTEAFRVFGRRKRRYGKVGSQLEGEG